MVTVECGGELVLRGRFKVPTSDFGEDGTVLEPARRRFRFQTAARGLAAQARPRFRQLPLSLVRGDGAAVGATSVSFDAPLRERRALRRSITAFWRAVPWPFPLAPGPRLRTQHAFCGIRRVQRASAQFFSRYPVRNIHQIASCRRLTADKVEQHLFQRVFISAEARDHRTHDSFWIQTVVVQ